MQKTCPPSDLQRNPSRWEKSSFSKSVPTIQQQLPDSRVSVYIQDLLWYIEINDVSYANAKTIHLFTISMIRFQKKVSQNFK